MGSVGAKASNGLATRHLLIAKLDRLARNVHFISGLMETGVPFVAADMPTATPFMLHIYAAMAEAEGIAISTRTKAALAAAKARGVKLVNPRLLAGSPCQARMAAAVKSAKATARATDLLPVIAEVRAAGVATLSGIVNALMARVVPTPSGRGARSPATVMRLDRRVSFLSCADNFVQGFSDCGVSGVYLALSKNTWINRMPGYIASTAINSMMVLKFHRQHILHDGLAGLKVNCAMDVQAVPPLLCSTATGTSFGAQQPTGRQRRLDAPHRRRSSLHRRGLCRRPETALPRSTDSSFLGPAATAHWRGGPGGARRNRRGPNQSGRVAIRCPGIQGGSWVKQNRPNRRWQGVFPDFRGVGVYNVGRATISRLAA